LLLIDTKKIIYSVGWLSGSTPKIDFRKKTLSPNLGSLGPDPGPAPWSTYGNVYLINMYATVMYMLILEICSEHACHLYVLESAAHLDSCTICTHYYGKDHH
jgi:hypothetical protein